MRMSTVWRALRIGRCRRSKPTPYLLKEAAAPHIAAAQEGIRLNIVYIVQCYETVAQRADCVIVEGVGGFRVPLGPTEDTADLACALRLPLILVVGLRLGCLNHALLAAEAIAVRGLSLAGWVANQVDPALRYKEANIEALQIRLADLVHAPLLGCIPYLQQNASAAVHAVPYLNLGSLAAQVSTTTN